LPEFFNYVANSVAFLGFARRMAIPSVQQSNLNSTRYGRLWIPLPPLEEQHCIVNSLNAMSLEVHATQSVLRKQIDTLTAYRKSLIHECVTGQRRIGEAELAAAGLAP
jgi:type I restriction enzyme S subunit